MDNLPDLSVRQLKAIVALARFESFIAAAAYLNVSPSGLTRLVQQAESLVGVQLFHRGTRKVVPTEAGAVIVQASQRLLSDLSLQVQSARALDGELRGQLSISSLMSISHRVVPHALIKFRRKYPNVHVHVREGLGDNVLNNVSRGYVDFGIANIESAPVDLAIAASAEETCFLILSKSHPMAALKTVPLKKLADEQLVSMPPESGLRKAIDMATNSQGIALNHSIIINQFGSLFDFVGNGLGIAIAPAVALPSDGNPAIVVKSLRPRITRRIGILHPKDRPLTPVAEAFLEIFQPIFLAAIK
jgi:LysR family carnitine catabolism transcriptional activator